MISLSRVNYTAARDLGFDLKLHTLAFLKVLVKVLLYKCIYEEKFFFVIPVDARQEIEKFNKDKNQSISMSIIHYWYDRFLVLIDL